MGECLANCQFQPLLITPALNEASLQGEGFGLPTGKGWGEAFS